MPVEQIVDKPEDLPAICAQLAAASCFGFDTEFVGEGNFHPQLCLIQVSTPERLILIDPFKVGPLEAFWQVVTNPAHLVVVHSGRAEIRMCQTACGRPPGRCFDVQLAAGLVGLPYPLGHAALVSQVLHKSLSKSETLTDWRARPLTQAQIRYAFDDVRYLLPLHHELTKRLNRHGRISWAEEEFARLTDQALQEIIAPEKWRKLPGIGNLSAQKQAAARALYLWRHQRAEKAGRPPRTICRDDLLVEIARRDPRTVDDLKIVRGLAKRDLEVILQVVAEARELPPSEWPDRPEKEPEPPQMTLLTNLLQAVVAHLAQQMRLAPSMMATVNDLKGLVRRVLDKSQRPSDSLLDQGWRKVHLRPLLEGVLQGDSMIRVTHPGAQAPLEFVPTPTKTPSRHRKAEEPTGLPDPAESE
jgi:ribonuclease D